MSNLPNLPGPLASKSIGVLKQKSQCLPPFDGSKRGSLGSWTFSKLASVLPVSLWSKAVFLDAFLGGGSVSYRAKAYGFSEIHCNDWSIRSQLIALALIQNCSTTLTDMDILLLLQPRSPGDIGLIEKEFSGRVFARRHARVLDDILHNSQQFSCPIKKALISVECWHLVTQLVAFATSVGSSNKPFAQVLDNEANWWELNPKRLQDGSFGKLLEPIHTKVKKIQKKINNGIIGAAGPISIYRQDALEFVRQARGSILYLDPPYAGTKDYETSNKVLDAVLTGQLTSERVEKSPYSHGTEALQELLHESAHIPIWLLSYGNKIVGLDDLVALVQKARPNHAVKGWARLHRHYCHVSKNLDNQELLILSVDSNFLDVIERGGPLHATA